MELLKELSLYIILMQVCSILTRLRSPIPVRTLSSIIATLKKVNPHFQRKNGQNWWCMIKMWRIWRKNFEEPEPLQKSNKKRKIPKGRSTKPPISIRMPKRKVTKEPVTYPASCVYAICMTQICLGYICLTVHICKCARVTSWRYAAQFPVVSNHVL